MKEKNSLKFSARQHSFQAFHAGRVGVVKDGIMSEWIPNKQPSLKKWITEEKEVSFGEFNIQMARKMSKTKFVAVAVDEGILITYFVAK